MTRQEALKLAKSVAAKNPEHYAVQSSHCGISVCDNRRENIHWCDERKSSGTYHLVLAIEPQLDGVYCNKRTHDQIVSGLQVDWTVTKPEDHRIPPVV